MEERPHPTAVMTVWAGGGQRRGAVGGALLLGVTETGGVLRRQREGRTANPVRVRSQPRRGFSVDAQIRITIALLPLGVLPDGSPL